MSIIQVKFDNTLEQTNIIIPLTNTSKNEVGERNYIDNQQEIQQTSIYGIQAPLISINSVVIDFIDVIDFELKCINTTPTIHVIAKDRYKLSATIDTPTLDNELRLQILPKFDNLYKKINLTFYITSFKIDKDLMFISGEYKAPKFISSNLKSFGELCTYSLFETIANETGLGFATNIEMNEGDKRFIYCDNKSYSELLKNEIQRSGVDLQICDYWIDWWNNLILADIYERYNAIDSDSDLQIWISGYQNEISEGVEMEPQQVVATLTNHPSVFKSELHISNYNIINKPGSQMYKGTDHVYSTYEHIKTEYMDYLVQDGDTQTDIFCKYEYLGEVYGEYNYLLAGRKRDAFLQKINSNEAIEITIDSPLLGLMRGNKVNLAWYNNDSDIMTVQNIMNESGLIVAEPTTNINMDDPGNTPEYSQDGKFVLDKSISGQYLITGCKMKFHNHKWDYKVILRRPTIMKPKILV